MSRRSSRSNNDIYYPEYTWDMIKSYTMGNPSRNVRKFNLKLFVDYDYTDPIILTLSKKQLKRHIINYYKYNKNCKQDDAFYNTYNPESIEKILNRPNKHENKDFSTEYINISKNYVLDFYDLEQWLDESELYEEYLPKEVPYTHIEPDEFTQQTYTHSAVTGKRPDFYRIYNWNDLNAMEETNVNIFSVYHPDYMYPYKIKRIQ